MGLWMIVAGLILLAAGWYQIRMGKVQNEIAPFIPQLAAGVDDPAAVARFKAQSESVFQAHNVVDPKRKRALANYARLDQNVAVRTLLSQQTVW